MSFALSAPRALPHPALPACSALLLVLPSWSLGCTLPVVSGDAGSDAGGASHTPVPTVGDRCAAMFAEVCSQSIDRCAAIGSLSDCIAMSMPTCCTGTLCNAPSKVSSATAAACNGQIDLEQCYDLSTHPIPDACQGVLHQP
ncbi:MAG: hypothetical protein M3O36_06415 [Myxococcota bacterium]|nr:hypothetical protein [Myxococcota bacterium]